MSVTGKPIPRAGRRLAILGLIAGLALPPLASPAGAQTGAAPAGETMEQSLTRQLQDQGYGNIRLSRTLLGRIYVIAEAGDIRREIVVNPATGEILRDILREPASLATIQRDRGGEGEGRQAAVTGVDLPERMVGGDVLGAAGDVKGSAVGDLSE